MNYKDYEYKIRSSKFPIVIDFWAPWCGPCKALDPILSQAKTKFSGKVNVLKVNADENPEVMQKLGIYSIPTMIAYVEGKQVFRKTGMQSAAALDKLFVQLAEGKQEIEKTKLSSTDRIIRLTLGVGLIAAGIYFGVSWILIGLGGVVAFSAVYDRCPIYKAVSKRISALFQKKVGNP